MAGVFHISEQDAARDFAALLRRVRAGDEVVVEEDGRAVAVLRSTTEDRSCAGAPRDIKPGKTVEEIVAGLRRWEAEHGPVRMDADFADDVEEAHRRLNQPLDELKWG
ncbi:MAG: hypothetical protein M3O02_06520 [Acidobacteriota bacterium]|nr:hypothetical protein [Acidobacteriota bacterium]